MGIDIAIFIFFIVLSGLFSGMEIAFFSLSPGAVRAMVNKGYKNATLIERLKNDSQRLLIVILLGNNLVNIAAAALATNLSLQLFGSAGVGIATGIVTIIVLLFGEIFPKSIAQVYAQPIAAKSAKFIIALQWLLWPIVAVLAYLSEKSLRYFKTHTHHPQIKDEVEALVTLGKEQGHVKAHEQDFIERLFEFNDRHVEHIMTPIDKVIMLDVEAIVSQVSYFAAHSGYSRFPVYEGNRNNIVGMVHIKDIFKAIQSDGRANPVDEIYGRAYFIQGTEVLITAFRQMQQVKTHNMIVKDGQKVIGMITLEDLLEELLGELYDESDNVKKSVIS